MNVVRIIAWGLLLPLLLLTAACACSSQPPEEAVAAKQAWNAKSFIGPAGEPAASFPRPARAVADIVSDIYSDEASREAAGETGRVLSLAGVKPGMAVADIGAGSGYYTTRLAPAVGPTGRVFAQDIVPAYAERLRGRVAAAGLTNVTVTLGQGHDPRLLPNSIDRAFLVHMYHEIEQPYGLLWNLRSSLKPGGTVIIVDADRATNRHGTPLPLLDCELRAVGFTRTALTRVAADSYAAVYAPTEPRPEPRAIKACRG